MGIVTIKNPEQISIMRDAGHLLYEVYQELRRVVEPGISTWELDQIAEKLMRQRHATGSCKGYEGFPCVLCTSPDDVVVHGIPSKKVILQEGSLISIDTCLEYHGWQSDSAFTMGVGTISPEKQKLIDVTEQCFWAGARMAIAGNRLGDIGHAVQTLAEENGYGVVRDLTGHGIGRSIHEDPMVPNYGAPGHGFRLRPGMTICVEPMITMGTWRVSMDEKDGWTVRTQDHLPAAHYEHTLLINEDGLPELLTFPGFSWKEAE